MARKAEGGMPVKVNTEVLKEAVKKSGYTNKRLAIIIGVVESTIRTWLNGENNPQEEAFKKLCAVLDISEEELKFKEPEPPKTLMPPEKVKEPELPQKPVDRYLLPYYQKLFDEQIKTMQSVMAQIQKDNSELRAMLMETINILKMRESVDVMQIGAISMELCDYSFRQFKKKATEKANEIIAKKAKYKSTNEVYSDVYKLLRAEYGIVWEQEKKEFVEVNGYQPASTLQLCYWIEANKPTYHNLFFSKLDTLLTTK